MTIERRFSCEIKINIQAMCYQLKGDEILLKLVCFNFSAYLVLIGLV